MFYLKFWPALFLCLVMQAAAGQIANRFDILIVEIYADPIPPVGLPNSEFIELKNISSVSFNIRNWKIVDGNNTATINRDFILQPDSFVIICPTSATTAFSVFGSVLGLPGFPDLNNQADVVTLYSAESKIIHSISYHISWYQNDIKANGGWTLEMIDTRNICGGISNWKASVDNRGGTPGKKNSVDGNNKDDLPPALLRTYTLDSTTIVAVFDEPLDSSAASQISKYQISNGIGNPVSATPAIPVFTEVILRFSSALKSNIVYTLTVSLVTDCLGNTIGIRNTAKLGLPVESDSLDVVINEVLFDPKGDGYDYFELYNPGNKIIDLKQLYVSNRSVTGGLSNIEPLNADSYLFFPGEHLVWTKNKKWVAQNYIVKNYESLIEVSSLPSLPNDQGSLVLTNIQGKVLDELHYNESWHFALINNEEGIALERIDYTQPTQNKDNWTSAASTVGFGTPGYQNSQFRVNQQIQGNIVITPKIFSPDNDGFDDFTVIHYTMTEPGFVGNLTIFDANGKLIRYLAKNATLASWGNFRWDGLGENQNRLPVGIYIVLTEVFNLKGKTKKFKNTVILARRF